MRARSYFCKQNEQDTVPESLLFVPLFPAGALNE
jgi:hypothetical protein